MQSNIVISKSMATPPVRRNSAYGQSSSANSSSTRSSKTSQSMRRSQSMRYPQRHHNNNNSNNNNHSTVNGISSSNPTSIQQTLNKGHRVASIPSNIVELNSEKSTTDDDFNYTISNGTAHKNVNKINGKSDNLFNFIIAKDVDHFKNQKVFRVLVVGSPDSGKTSLISQFSYFLEEHRKQFEYKQTKYDQTQEQYLILNFVEIISLDNCFPRSPIAMYQPDAYIVLFAVNDRESFVSAKQLIHEIHKWDDLDMKPVILVANKTDLVRSRTVTKQEGRQVAMANNCKYIETSCAISHNIDFLLAGIGAQINLKNNTKQAHISSTRKPNLFKRLLRKAALNKSKSCDNLHVL